VVPRERGHSGDEQGWTIDRADVRDWPYSLGPLMEIVEYPLV